MEHALELTPFPALRDGDPVAVVRLAAGATLARPLRAGTCIAVKSGRVWLTQSGDANDYFVDAGQHHVIARGGRVVIEACTPQATLRVLSGTPPARPGFP
jgi:hypothetical protein